MTLGHFSQHSSFIELFIFLVEGMQDHCSQVINKSFVPNCNILFILVRNVFQIINVSQVNGFMHHQIQSYLHTFIIINNQLSNQDLILLISNDHQLLVFEVQMGYLFVLSIATDLNILFKFCKMAMSLYSILELPPEVFLLSFQRLVLNFF